MKNIALWLVTAFITFCMWVVTFYILQDYPQQMAIVVNGSGPGMSWHTASAIWAFPIVLTIAWLSISILNVLHSKKRLSLPYDPIDPKLSQSLLNLTYFIIAVILFAGEISLLILNI